MSTSPHCSKTLYSGYKKSVHTTVKMPGSCDKTTINLFPPLMWPILHNLVEKQTNLLEEKIDQIKNI